MNTKNNYLIGISIAIAIIAAVVAALLSTKVSPIEFEGSDASWSTQLLDSGYDSGGVY